MGFFELIKWVWEQFERYIWPFVMIHSYERGVILTFGKNPKLLNPGFHLKWLFFQELFSTPVTPDTLCTKAIHTTTLDGKTISVEPAIEFEIEDAVKWLIDANDARSNLYDIVRGVVSDYITDLNWLDVTKKSTLTEIKKRVNKRCEYMGAKITNVMLTDMCISRVIITQI